MERCAKRLCCVNFAGLLVFVHGVYVCILAGVEKQVSDCYTPSPTAYIEHHVMGVWSVNVARNVTVRQELRRLCQVWTKFGLGPSAPRTGPQFCLSFAEIEQKARD